MLTKPRRGEKTGSMPTRDIIVVGGSAGSVGALLQLARDLPEDLPAAILVVVHTSPEAPRILDQILGRRSRMRVDYASDGEAVRSGRILLAPPDCHLILDDGLVRLSRGPNENRFRPAIDPLFRSAAESYGRRVAGVVLSGVLDDGTFGLLSIKRRGGVAIVQDLDDAMFASMPRSALASVEVDHVVPAAEMASLLTRLAVNGRRGGARTSMEKRARRRPAETIAKNEDPIHDNSPAPSPVERGEIRAADVAASGGSRRATQRESSSRRRRSSLRSSR